MKKNFEQAQVELIHLGTVDTLLSSVTEAGGATQTTGTGGGPGQE